MYSYCRTVARAGDMRNAYKPFMWKPEKKNPFARFSLRWEGILKQIIKWEYLRVWIPLMWIRLQQGFVDMKIKFRVPLNWMGGPVVA
jgi:hypothetical protein